MLGSGERGFLVEKKSEDIVAIIEECKYNADLYHSISNKCVVWSQLYTIEKLNLFISELL